MSRSLSILALLATSCSAPGESPWGDPVHVASEAQDLDFAQPGPSALLRDIHGNAEALMRWSDAAHIWNDAAPSSNSHRLLACGARCQTRANDSLVETWIASATDAHVHELHRGEFLASLATANIPPNRRLPKLGDETVDSRLTAQLDAALEDTPQRWNEREVSRGVEFGWLLQAACHYRGAGLGVASDRARQLLGSAMVAARNAATEAGTHELEGLATCLRDHAAAGPASLDSSYELVNSYLERRMDEDLNAQRASGPLYADAETFDTCRGALCEVLGDANRQAHFFEWVTLVPGAAHDARLAEPLERLRDLTREGIERLPPSQGVEPWWPLLASSATHTAHVATKLNRLAPTRKLR